MKDSLKLVLKSEEGDRTPKCRYKYSVNIELEKVGMNYVSEKMGTYDYRCIERRIHVNDYKWEKEAAYKKQEKVLYSLIQFMA